VTGKPVWVPAQPVAPGLFVFEGTRYVSATHDAGNFVGPAAQFSADTAPAGPGEVVTIFAAGLGQTTPPLVNGAKDQAGDLLDLPVIKIGGEVAEVRSASAAGPGVYRILAVVPPTVIDGDNEVTLSYGGFSAQRGILIAVLRTE
jgi:uncharacterized protein (TIGR03437 family)